MSDTQSLNKQRQVVALRDELVNAAHMSADKLRAEERAFKLMRDVCSEKLKPVLIQRNNADFVAAFLMQKIGNKAYRFLVTGEVWHILRAKNSALVHLVPEDLWEKFKACATVQGLYFASLAILLNDLNGDNMPHEQGKYGLAKLDMLKKDSPEFIKAARQGSSNKPENLEKRRIDFQQEYMILQALIAQIQVFNKELHETKDSNAGAELEQKIAAYSNLANLKGLAGLYEGFAMLADMLSIRTVARDEDDKPILTEKGEKIIIRVPALYDIGSYCEDLIERVDRGNHIAFKIALKQNAVHVAQRGVDPDAQAVSQPVALSEEAPAGVPEGDLKAAQETPTEQQVKNFVTGENK